MKMFLLGATGATGREVIRQAPTRGHTVTAFGRSKAEAPARSIEGDVTSPSALAAGMAGHDVVVFALGPRDLGPTQIYSTSSKAMLEAMAAAGVKRLVVVSVATLFPGLMGPLGGIPRYVLRHGIADARIMEDQVRAAPVDWTILRPPRLTNAKGSGKYQTAIDALPKWRYTISRADLATSMIDVAERPEHTHQLLGVTG